MAKAGFLRDAATPCWSAVLTGCIWNGGRECFFDTVSLANLLEAEARDRREGLLADELVRRALVVLNKLGCLPFARTGGQLMPHLRSRLARACP